MRTFRLFPALLMAFLALTGCSIQQKQHSPIISVLVEAGEHYTLKNHRVTVRPGENAVLWIQPDENYTVTSTDYAGSYQLTESAEGTRLELTEVRYPTRVQLKLSHDSRSIRYLANGGHALTAAGTDVTEHYDVRIHSRPNVSIGTDLFEWEGFTLTGWNAKPDGTGQRVGLGSRMTVADSVELYAQWERWTPAEHFSYRIEDGTATITACSETGSQVVVPEYVDGFPVTALAADSFKESPAQTVILPKSLQRIEENAFDGANLRTLYFFDNIEFITDACFSNCEHFSTLYISAIEEPYGYAYRRESLLADKLDMLISTMGQPRIIFYGGCAMWYNLIGAEAQKAFGNQYTILNMGVNGVCSSLFQMELMKNFVTERDILFHTPEISSRQQLLTYTGMSKNDDKIWCAMEYNYDLVSLLDIRAFDGGVLESFRRYLDKKKPGGRYTDEYRDSGGNSFLDELGCIPFVRSQPTGELADKVELDPQYLENLSQLEREYGFFTEKGIPVYVSFAAIDYDQLPKSQQGNLEMMNLLYQEKFNAMPGVKTVGRIEEFVFSDGDFYDTVYHLLTEPAKRCTASWIHHLKDALLADGLWNPPQA